MKTRVALIVAVVLAVFSAFAVNMLIERQKRELEKKTESVYILVTARGLNKGHVMKESDFAVDSIQEQFFRGRDMIMPNEKSTFVGLTLQRSIAGGGMLFKDDFRKKDLTKMKQVERIPTGKRILTLKVDFTGGVGGLLSPGDRVDVYWVHTADQRNRGAKATALLLSNMLIFALDNRTGLKSVTANRGYGSVSVIATPEESQLLIQAQESGIIKLALRNKRDVKVIQSTTLIKPEIIIEQAKTLNKKR